MLSSKPLKPKRCRNTECRQSFQPRNSLQVVCSPKCGLALAAIQRKRKEGELAKLDRAQNKEKREQLKTRGDYTKEAQQAFNEFIRWRDRVAGHACISSGKPLDWSGNAVDAGHYRSTGSAPHLRFDERNCHAQSKHDNRYLSGNAVDYRLGLIARIGLEEVEALEADQAPKHYSIEDLKAITREYRAKTKELKKTLDAMAIGG
jgi:hypothetical protein